MQRKWLSDIRKKYGLTQEQLAKLCNVKQTQIANIETGHRNPSPKLAQRLAVILKFEWTIFYEDNNEK